MVSIVSDKLGGSSRVQSQVGGFGARMRGTFSSPLFGFVSGCAGVIFATPSGLPLCPVMMRLDMLEDAESLSSAVKKNAKRKKKCLRSVKCSSFR